MGERRSLTGSGAPGLSLEGHADRAPSDDGFESPSSPGHDKDAELEAKIRQVFAQLDEDNSGSISTEELDEMLKMLGMEDEDRAVRLPILVQHMDSDGDGVITEVEFVTAAIELGLFTPREDPNAAKLARAMIVFDEIDNDGNRSLDHVELQNVLIKLGCHDEVWVSDLVPRMCGPRARRHGHAAEGGRGGTMAAHADSARCDADT